MNHVMQELLFVTELAQKNKTTQNMLYKGGKKKKIHAVQTSQAYAKVALKP